jgi:hypothetical protein
LDGSINIGDFGEIVTAIVLLFAYDEAMHECVKNLDPTAVTLERFTKLLLREPVKDAIFESTGTDQGMRSMQLAVKLNPYEEGHWWRHHRILLNIRRGGIELLRVADGC